jgi:hypothetical protein
MKAFLKGILSENGIPSSKRVICFLLLFTFLFEVLYNMLAKGHPAPTETLQSQLYYTLVTNLGLIFGSNIVNSIKDAKLGGNPQPPAAN